ncbi:MAG: Gfo/Idh/MocA family oxidoreductase [Flavobacteriales bacterium]|nr:Gfo/Idh/MocA family oxidoreductase [Flavobacteriales bacterium]
MSKTDKINFAIVGAGHIGKRHATMVQNNPSSELLAMCDTRAENELGLDAFEVPFYNDLDEMLNKTPEIDVVCICTPNGMHADQAIIALKANKHVVVEKPIGLSKNHCEEMIHISLQKDRKVFCVMQNRYSPPSVWLKEIVDKKMLGDIYMVNVNCYWNRDERYYKKGGWKGTQELDGGTLYTQFSHFVDLMFWLFGDVKNIQGKFRDFAHKDLTDFEDTGTVLFDLIRGGMGSINYSTAVWNKNFESSLTVIGSKGTVKVGGQYMNEVIYCDIENYVMPELPEGNPPNDYGDYKGSAANHHYIIENVIDTLKNKTVATTNVMEGLKVVDIIERIYEVRNRQHDIPKITHERV